MQIIEQLIAWKMLLCIAVGSAAIEFLLPLHKRPLRAGLTTDAAYVVVNTLIVRLGLVVLLAVLGAFARSFVPGTLTAAVGAQPLWLQIPEVIVIGDFCLYWAHRALHQNPYLWRVHAIHHSVKELDWVASYHAHPLDEIVLTGAALGAVCLLGFSPVAIGVYLLVYSYMAVAVHLNTRMTIGPFKWVIGSPEFHHWHHSNEPDARDRNFAAIISLWDVLFGTMFLPHRAPRVYGIDDVVPPGYVDQTFHPFRRRVRSAPVADVADSVPNLAPPVR